MQGVLEIQGIGDGYRLGAGVKLLSGAAAGRQLYANSVAGDVLFCDGFGEANLHRFADDRRTLFAPLWPSPGAGT